MVTSHEVYPHAATFPNAGGKKDTHLSSLYVCTQWHQIITLLREDACLHLYLDIFN